MHSDDFLDFLDRLTRSDRLDLSTEIMQQFLHQSGLSHMSYAALNLPGPTMSRPLLAMTYTPDWQRHYAQQGYVDIDPVVQAGLGGILPVDWSEIDRSSPIVRKFFGEAQDFKVGSCGLSIPIRGRSGEFALFSVTSDESSMEWNARRGDIIRDLMLMAWNFHASALRSIKAEDLPPPVLSPREAACLRRKAQGKSDKEIAEILGISAHTVRFHLECARTRLNASNATHAVAKAIGSGLINLSYEPEHML